MALLPPDSPRRRDRGKEEAARKQRARFARDVGDEHGQAWAHQTPRPKRSRITIDRRGDLHRVRGARRAAAGAARRRRPAGPAQLHHPRGRRRPGEDHARHQLRLAGRRHRQQGPYVLALDAASVTGPVGGPVTPDNGRVLSAPLTLTGCRSAADARGGPRQQWHARSRRCSDTPAPRGPGSRVATGSVLAGHGPGRRPCVNARRMRGLPLPSTRQGAFMPSRTRKARLLGLALGAAALPGLILVDRRQDGSRARVGQRQRDPRPYRLHCRPSTRPDRSRRRCETPRAPSRCPSRSRRSRSAPRSPQDSLRTGGAAVQGQPAGADRRGHGAAGPADRRGRRARRQARWAGPAARGQRGRAVIPAKQSDRPDQARRRRLGEAGRHGTRCTQDPGGSGSLAQAADYLAGQPGPGRRASTAPA